MMEMKKNSPSHQSSNHQGGLTISDKSQTRVAGRDFRQTNIILKDLTDDFS
jgi:hypothetical protein